MRILLDEAMPVRMRSLFPGHEVRTVRYMGWLGRVNGELLALARGEFDVLVTCDQEMEFQQNITQADVPIVVLAAITNSQPDLEPLMPRVLEILPTLKRGDVFRIAAG